MNGDETLGILRFLLAMSVVAAHGGAFWPSMFAGVGGIVAVEAFFVISGFYMALVLRGTYRNRNKAFYVNRALRIFPEFWIVAIVVVVLRVVVQHEAFLAQMAAVPFPGNIFLMLSNTVIFGSDTVMFLQTNGDSVQVGPFLESTPPLFTLLLIPQAWTLALELMFYLLAPFLVRLRSRILIAIIVLAFVGKYVVAGAILGLGDPWTYRFFPFELAFFLIGVLLFRFTDRENPRLFVRTQQRRAIVVFGSLVAILLLAPTLFTWGASVGPFFSSYLVPLVLVVAISALVPSLFVLTRRVKWDAKIGAYSYPIYLSHLIVIGGMLTVADQPWMPRNPTVLFAILVVGAVAAAWPLVRAGVWVDSFRSKVRTPKLNTPLPDGVPEAAMPEGQRQTTPK
ncbi:acyltransferase [Cryobacterium frigoriphilum]|uniref:Acyltransferase n=1 Tax=Cryobacterium frigoriphilum TaxID=1259150 RepID=A0A4R9A293_9MICO|nr:acyltransferase [Cryobacterium frigoriphilum]TFD50777.1 acyltransferase [Cryobacterium frigoriphilum]